MLLWSPCKKIVQLQLHVQLYYEQFVTQSWMQLWLIVTVLHSNYLQSVPLLCSTIAVIMILLCTCKLCCIQLWGHCNRLSCVCSLLQRLDWLYCFLGTATKRRVNAKTGQQKDTEGKTTKKKKDVGDSSGPRQMKTPKEKLREKEARKRKRENESEATWVANLSNLEPQLKEKFQLISKELEFLNTLFQHTRVFNCKTCCMCGSL